MARTQVRGLQVLDETIDENDIKDGSVRGSDSNLNTATQREIAQGTVSTLDLRDGCLVRGKWNTNDVLPIITQNTIPSTSYEIPGIIWYRPLDLVHYMWDDNLKLWLSVDEMVYSVGFGGTNNNRYLRRSGSGRLTSINPFEWYSPVCIVGASVTQRYNRGWELQLRDAANGQSIEFIHTINAVKWQFVDMGHIWTEGKRLSLYAKNTGQNITTVDIDLHIHWLPT